METSGVASSQRLVQTGFAALNHVFRVWLQKIKCTYKEGRLDIEVATVDRGDSVVALDGQNNVGSEAKLLTYVTFREGDLNSTVSITIDVKDGRSVPSGYAEGSNGGLFIVIELGELLAYGGNVGAAANRGGLGLSVGASSRERLANAEGVEIPRKAVGGVDGDRSTLNGVIGK